MKRTFLKTPRETAKRLLCNLRTERPHSYTCLKGDECEAGTRMWLSPAPTPQGRPSPPPGAPQVSAKCLVSLRQAAPAPGLARGRWCLAVQPAAPLLGGAPPSSCVDSRACGLGGWGRSRLPPLLRRWSRAPGRPRGSITRMNVYAEKTNP